MRRSTRQATATFVWPVSTGWRRKKSSSRSARGPGERIVCRKERGRWRILAPVQTDADETSVTRLLADVAEARVERTLAGRPDDLAAFGLERPLRLTVAAGPARQTIEVGKENPT